MKPLSFRWRLTLWNLFILAFALAVFGLGLSITNTRRVSSDIDRELEMRARRAQGGMGPGQNGMGPGGRPPDGDGFGLPLPPEQGQQPGGMDRDPGGYLRRPQFTDRSGQPIGRGPLQRPFDPVSLDAAQRGERLYSTVEIAGERVRVLSVPWLTPDGPRGAIQVARELRDYDLLWSAQVRTLLILLPIALLAAGGGALFLTNRALKPVADVTQAAASIGEQDLSRRLPVSGDDELAGLAQTFNEMIARLEASFANLRAAYAGLEESYENQRRFTADASHELRTPLTRLRLATSSALAGTLTVDEARKTLQVADAAAESMAILVQQLLVLSRADAGDLGLQRRDLDLRVVASDAMSHCPTPKGHVLVPEFPSDPVMVSGDEDHLRRVFLNLIENAVRHTPSEGRITVSVRRRGDRAVATVEDTGDGISPEHLPHVFDRFFRADKARSRDDGGSGLGLAICKSIVEAHGGDIRIDSRVGIGTTVTVEIPSLASISPGLQTASS
jgi:two-component system, OmpR family, sensor kinase